jgi:hypothetical protein
MCATIGDEALACRMRAHAARSRDSALQHLDMMRRVTPHLHRLPDVLARCTL